jgi:hypothetical protein
LELIQLVALALLSASLPPVDAGNGFPTLASALLMVTTAWSSLGQLTEMGAATSAAAPTIIPSTLSFFMIHLHEVSLLTEFSEHCT